MHLRRLTSLISLAFLSLAGLGVLGLAAAPAANALTIRITEFQEECCLPGETFTIGVRLIEEPGDIDLFGIAISISGYGANDFVEGSAVSSYLHTFADPAIGALGGFENLAGPNLRESAIGANGNRVELALSARISPLPRLTPAPAPGADPGLDGVVGGGDAMFRITFTFIEPAIIHIGTTYQGDGLTGPGGARREARGASARIGYYSSQVLTPEPSTALLLGLGLASLGLGRRRSL